MGCKINSFTLVEVIVVLVIIGVGIALFYGLLFLNWLSYETELRRIELHQQMDEIFQRLKRDVREASSFSLASPLQGGPANSFHEVTISYPAFLNREDVTYLIDPDTAQLLRTENQITSVLSSNLGPQDSFFQNIHGGLFVRLVLQDRSVWAGRIEFEGVKQIFHRN